MKPFTPFIFISIFLILSFSISGCSKSKLLTVYKIDIQQGNAVDPEKVEQLEIGMTKEQVEFLLGTPLLTDVFHPERWDYVYFLIPGFGERERRHLTLEFDGNYVAEIHKKHLPEPANEEISTVTDKAVNQQDDES